ncbi:3173_t:CDS:2, partial [Cetraspora pellucida]
MTNTTETKIKKVNIHLEMKIEQCIKTNENLKKNHLIKKSLQEAKTSKRKQNKKNKEIEGDVSVAPNKIK